VFSIYEDKNVDMHQSRRTRSPARPKAVQKAIDHAPKAIQKTAQLKPILVHPQSAPAPAATIFDPQVFIRQNGIRNTYDICVIKKFIGKKILIPAKHLILTVKIKEDAKNIKSVLLEKNSSTPKNLIMHVVCINGTMNVINGYHYYLALNSISYKDIDANEHMKNIEIKLVQLPKVSNIELHKLIEYFS
jgi:hypothetical protein